MAVESNLLGRVLNEAVEKNEFKINDELKRIADQAHIEHLFRSFARTKSISVLVYNLEQQIHGTINFNYKRGTEPLLILEGEYSLNQNALITITFFFKESLIKFETTIIRCLENGYQINKPDLILTSFKRFLSRYCFNDEDKAIIQISGQSDANKLFDLSVNGLSFVSKEVLSEGHTLRYLTIQVGDQLHVVVNGEIRHVHKYHDGYKYGVVFSGVEWKVHQQLFSFIFKRCYPEIKPINEFSLEDLSGLYQQSKYLSLKPTDEDDRNFLNLIRKLEKVKAQPLFSTSYVYYKNGKLISIGTSTRIYNRTFLQQHLLNAPEVGLNPKAKTDIYISLADSLLSHPYFNNLIIYISQDLDWHQDLFSKMDAIINDQNKLVVNMLMGYECTTIEIDYLSETGNYQFEQLIDTEEFINYCRNYLKPLEVKCYGYEDFNLKSDELNTIYRTQGFYRERKLWRIVKSGITVAYAVVEVYDDSLDLFGILDNCRIYPIDESIERSLIIGAILPVLGKYYQEFHKDKFYIFWDREEEKCEFELSGLKTRTSIGRILMSRDGLAEYKKILMMDFEYYSKYYPLTHPQKGIWYLEKMYPGTSVGTIAGTVRIKGKVDFKLLEQAINIVIEKNDGLRLRICIGEDSEPKQYLANYQYKKFDFFDFTRKTEEFYDWNEKQTQIPMAIIDSDLFYFAIFKTGNQEGGFFGKLHHLISDAWSTINVTNQVLDVYQGLANDINVKVEKRPSYLDYVLEEDSYKYSLKYEKDKEYWEKKYDTIPEFTRFDNKESYRENIKSKRKTLVVGKRITQSFNDFCKQRGISVHTLFLAALAVYINQITDKEDIVIGIPILNRTNAKQKETIGMFISHLPIRVTVDPHQSFFVFLSYLINEWTLFLKHQKYPYDLIQKSFREKNRTLDNLYDITLSYQNVKLSSNNEQANTRWLPFGHQPESLNIHVFDHESEGQYILCFDYLISLFSESEIEKKQNHLINIIEDIVRDPNKNLFEFEKLSKAEKQQLLVDFNDTWFDYPRHKTIHELFEDQVRKTPNKIALQFEEKYLTYNELNNKANQIAEVLRNEGIKPNKIVGIMIERSIEMIIGIFGILKAGGAYLPIDPDYPRDRINYMFEDSGAGIVLTSQNIDQKINKSIKKIYIEDNKIYSIKPSILRNMNSSSDLAYVIYTSGSTGKPKGVMIEHKSINNFITGITEKIDFSEDKNILCLTTISFDIFVLETLLPLIKGLKITIANEKEQHDPNLLIELIRISGINMLQLTPSRLKMIFKSNSDLSCFNKVEAIMIGGEACSFQLKEKLKTYTNAKIYNMYGPTETTVWSTINEITNLENPNIGKPIINTNIYIVNKEKQLQPVGNIGELCIAGDGLARGYINSPELTSERFIPNPFEAGKLMYRTGDLAKWCLDGSIDFIGRKDNQVKIRGFRIETDEIEKRLLKHELIKEALVIAGEYENGENYLCAYLVTDKNIKPYDIREFLAEKLPDYMIPTYFVNIEEIPLTPNGKVNRKALPEPNSALVSMEIVKPENEIEDELIGVWKKILEIAEVGTNQNFFEVGGHSLKAISLATEVLKKFDVDIAISEIFRLKTIKRIAEYIVVADKKPFVQINPAPKLKFYPVSSSQKRMFLINQRENISINYNISVPIIIKGKIDIKRFEKAFEIMIERHESLRTSFDLVNGEIIQYIHEEIDFKIDHIEIDPSKKDEFILDFIKPFDLKKAPLFRVCLAYLNSDEYLLVMDIHHIIADGFSIGLILNEFISLYNGKNLSKPRLQYKDYAVWQKELLNSEVIKKQETYWRKVLSGEIPYINMPTSYKRTDSPQYVGETVKFTIEAKNTEMLKIIANKHNATLSSILLTIYLILLNRYSQQNDIIIGSIVAGRNFPELEHIIGTFNNFLPIRFYVDSNLEFEKFLNESNKSIMKSYENMDYPYDKMIENFLKNPDHSRNPFFDIVFNFHNELDFGFSEQSIDLENSSIKLKRYEIELNVSKLDLRLDVYKNYDDELVCLLEFNNNLFNKEYIHNLINHFKNIINEITIRPGVKVTEIEILSEAEKRQLLLDFNNTDADYPKDETITSLFEAQVRKNPYNTAVAFEGKEMTYQELNDKSNKLAYYLSNEMNVVPDSLVGILMDKSLEMIIAILATLKAGGAYVPIDPDHPYERIKSIINDAQLQVLLSTKLETPILDRLQSECDCFGSYICLDTFDEIEEGDDKVDLANLKTKIWFESVKHKYDHFLVKPEVKPSNLAYIIYTSGTTGQPKGVMIEHRNVIRLLFNEKNLFNFSNQDVWTMFHSVCFDFSVWEMYGALLYGGKLIVIPKMLAKDSRNFLRLLHEENVTVLNQTPSAFYNLVNEELQFDGIHLSLRYIIFGGEALKPVMLKDWHQKYPQIKLINMYGITETTVHVTYKEIIKVDIDSNISNIGKPIPTLKTYIMDSNLKLLPTGVPGELCVGGDGVGRGYYGKADLTKERFVNNPYNRKERLYRSGDLVRIINNGEMEYLGRIDQQVKIRGFRIELKEIEAVLLKHDLVKGAVLIVKEFNGNKYLCAYLVLKEELPVREIRDYLAAYLPDYMIPAYFMRINQIPLTSNGKVDVKALPNIDGNNLETSRERPRNEIDEILLKAWEEILGSIKIGISDSFFEIGGDSLSVIRILASLYQHQFGLTIQDFYKYKTIKNITDKILGTLMEDPEPINTSNISVRPRKNDDKLTISKQNVELNKVLLTGATGFLGIHLLKELIIQTNATVYCLVRGANLIESKERLERLLRFYFSGQYIELINDRIKILNGDITFTNFGLSNEDLNRVAEEVDTVFHSAAIVKQFGNYADFENVNVLGTKRVMDFALNNKKRLNYISTIAVSGSHMVKQKGSGVSFTEHDFYTGQDYNENLYVRSKFEAENLLFKAMDSGLQATVYRMGNLTGRYEDGHFQVNTAENTFYRIIKSIVELHAVPSEILNHETEISPVDLCSKAIIKLSMLEASLGNVFHLFNPKYIKISTIVDYLNKLGYRINPYKNYIFKEYLNKLSQNEKTRDLLMGLFIDYDYEKAYRDDYMADLNADFTNKYLMEIGFDWPIINFEYFSKIIQYIENIGYINKNAFYLEEKEVIL